MACWNKNYLRIGSRNQVLSSGSITKQNQITVSAVIQLFNVFRFFIAFGLYYSTYLDFLFDNYCFCQYSGLIGWIYN